VSDWPLLLAAASAYLGAAARFVAVDGMDVLVAILATVGAACIGAWIHSVGGKDTL
jgi:hypothetical protein